MVFLLSISRKDQNQTKGISSSFSIMLENHVVCWITNIKFEDKRFP